MFSRSTVARLLIFRHAQSRSNAIKGGRVHVETEDELSLLNLQSDRLTPLTDQGVSQAVELGQKIIEKYKSIDVAYHSGYKRAQDTMIHAFGSLIKEIEVREELRFRERDSGYGHYMTKDKFKETFPFMGEYWKLSGSFLAVPPGGESVAQVRERRTNPALCEVLSDESLRGKTVVIFTHGRTIAAMKYDLDGWNVDRANDFLTNYAPRNCDGYLYERAIDCGKLQFIGPAF